jgi:hypothetical protein
MRPTTHSGETYPGADLTEPEVEFLLAMAKFQKITGRRYPSWREVLGVVHSLGYRRMDLHLQAQKQSQKQAQLQPSAASANSLEVQP